MIEYEQFSLDPNETIRKAHRFLNINEEEITIHQPKKIKKQSTKPTKSYILNYEELLNEIHKIFPNELEFS
jgi:hypothetical protein